jgi:hypothetical protein
MIYIPHVDSTISGSVEFGVGNCGSQGFVPPKSSL